MNYSKRTERKIVSLTELKPGDHIQVPCSIGADGFKSVPKSFNVDHHALVVKVVDEKRNTMKVIHKGPKGVEEKLTDEYTPEDITVLDYDSKYTGKKAIARAHEKMEEGYDVFTENCEHFVTYARTGVKESSQIEKIQPLVPLLEAAHGVYKAITN